MRRGNSYRIGVAAAVVLLATFVLAPASAAGPTVSVAVDGTQLADGETTVVNGDPTVSMDVSANSSIGSVSVRIDGETRHSFTPNSDSFSERVTLDITDGEHELNVVVSADSTVSTSATVIRDSTGPRASYTSPFSTSRLAPPPDRTTVDGAEVTLAADLFDTTGVSQVRIEHRYTYQFAGEDELARSTYRLDNPGDNFSQPLLLGTGENQLDVRYTDEQGQIRQHETSLIVRDEQRPSITVRSVTRPNDDERLRIAGTVSDNTKVNTLRLDIDLGTERTLVRETDLEPERSRLSIDFETTVRAGENVESVTLVAQDVDGNQRVREVPTDFERQIVPTIAVENVRLTDDGTTARVVGTVDAGEIQAVSVESVVDGETIDLTTVYSGDVTDEVSIDTEVDAQGAGTVVRVRVLDSRGDEHVDSTELSPQRTTTSQRDSTSTQVSVAADPTATDAVTEQSVGERTPTSTPSPTPEDGGQSGSGPLSGMSDLLLLVVGVVLFIAAYKWT